MTMLSKILWFLLKAILSLAGLILLALVGHEIYDNHIPMVKGTVVDMHTNQPIANAEITVRGSKHVGWDERTYASTVMHSDNNGYYSFRLDKPVDSMLLRVKMDGYLDALQSRRNIFSETDFTLMPCNKNHTMEIVADATQKSTIVPNLQIVFDLDKKQKRIKSITKVGYSFSSRSWVNGINKADIWIEVDTYPKDFHEFFLLLPKEKRSRDGIFFYDPSFTLRTAHDVEIAPFYSHEYVLDDLSFYQIIEIPKNKKFVVQHKITGDEAGFFVKVSNDTKGTYYVKMVFNPHKIDDRKMFDYTDNQQYRLAYIYNMVIQHNGTTKFDSCPQNNTKMQNRTK